MSHVSSLIAEDIGKYLESHQHKGLLRFITCGSVDDGKSTLIGRLLFESKMLFEDQLAALEADSRKSGTQGEALDLALLVDGLAAEREQGITIDVAYRFFSTDRRKFIVADTPGHEQYTRNMVTGASTADLAVILVDARKGLLTQTRRHSFLASLVGIRHVVLAVNKMDLMDWSQEVFDRIAEDYRAFAAGFGFETVQAIPLSALTGDGVVDASPAMPWYEGPTLMEYLETVEVRHDTAHKPFRMAVQWVSRPNLDFRGYAGTIAAGAVRPGDRIRVQPSGRESRVASIVTYEGDLPVAVAGQSVTLTLEDEIDISRGDLISAAEAPAQASDRFTATLVWMADAPMLPGRPYLVKLGTRTVPATVTGIRYAVDVNTQGETPARQLGLNEIGVVELTLNETVGFDPYDACPGTGGFIVIDRITSDTLGAGMLRSANRKATDVHWQAVDVTAEARARVMHQKPCVLWFTGLSGAGKSTIANLLEKRLHAEGRCTYLLDGDNVRHGLNRDLGFSAADRVENVRRMAEVARLMADAGLIVMVSLISPFRAERAMARDLMGEGRFLEVFVDAPLDVAESRDVKGLYARARRGEIKDFTGIDSPYEPPEALEVHIDTTGMSAEQAVDLIVETLSARGMFTPDLLVDGAAI